MDSYEENENACVGENILLCLARDENTHRCGWGLNECLPIPKKQKKKEKIAEMKIGNILRACLLSNVIST